MRFSSALALLAVASSVSAGSDVLDLTKSTFDKVVKGDGGLVLAEFFAPWCGHCKALAPQYEEAATELKQKGIKLAKVDCTVETELCQDYGIQGYPTLKVFSDGVPTDYTGPRKTDGIVSYMIKQSLPAVSEITADEHESFKSSDRVVIISYTPVGQDAPKAFTSFANAHRDSYLFGHTSDPAALDLASVNGPSIVLFKSFDEGRNDYPGSSYNSLTPDDIGSWIKIHAMPLIDEISPENFASYAEAGLPIAYLFVDPEDTKTNSKILKGLETVAKENAGKLSMVYIDAVKFAQHAGSLNLQPDIWPQFVIQDLEDQTKFPLKTAAAAALTPKAIQDFVNKYNAGEIKPDVKSAAIPADQSEPVYTLVADEWEKVIYEEGKNKDILLEIYAPWCGHCKRLAPVWETLAEKYTDIKDRLLVAKFDATENDVPPTEPFKVTGFPTIKFKPAGSEVFVDYQGDRSLESLIEFLEDTAVNSLDASVKVDPVVDPVAIPASTAIPAAATGHHDEL